MNAQFVLEQAVQHHRGGRLAEAEELYRTLLAASPDDADALHLLGLLRAQRGDAAGGRELIRRAIAIRPAADLFHINLASLCGAGGDTEEAITHFRQAIELNPQTPPMVHAELAQALAASGKFDEAVHALQWAIKRQANPNWLVMLSELLSRLGRQQEALDQLKEALRIRPDFADAHGALGLAMEREGRLEEAEACYRQALAIEPDLVAALNNLGHVLNLQRRWDEAAVVLRSAIERRPDLAPAYHHLGDSLRGQNKLNEAAVCYRQAVELNPTLGESWASLGDLLLAFRQLAPAAEALRQAAKLRPTAGIFLRLGRALGGLDQFDEAIAAMSKAAEYAPSSGEVYAALGSALQWCGRVDEAIVAYRGAVALDPANAAVHGNLLYAMLFQGGFTADEIHAEHVEWGRRHTNHITPLPPVEFDRSPGRRLRVGYISPNFRNHAVMSFIQPILENHEPWEVEVFCYSDTTAPDDDTRRIRERADEWRDTACLSDEQLARLIRKDQIDIVVELTGHIGQGRLGALAWKPAPVQVSYIGYQATTGMKAVDYFISDEQATPAGGERYFTERVYRLPQTFFCYAPPMDAPGVAPLATNHVTFGCQNNLAKVTGETIALWSRILTGVPGSRFILLIPGSRQVQARVLAEFEAENVPANRIEFVHRAPPREYLDRYNRIDIALDPVPFNGHTTTCDAAWMGCPTITLAGEIFAHRYGSSVLHHLGLGDLIASNTEQYVQIATTLANDLDRLIRLRSTLRERMRQSPITNAKQFTANLEQAYRRMWQGA